VLTAYRNLSFSADPSKMPLLGDTLVIAGTVCFAFSNVGQVGLLVMIYILLLPVIFSQNSNTHVLSLNM
jgi:solute carrier family 35 protein F1/2